MCQKAVEILRELEELKRKKGKLSKEDVDAVVLFK